MSEEATQYELANVAADIYGYYLPNPVDTKSETFKRARREAARHLRRRLELIESLTEEQFFKYCI